MERKVLLLSGRPPVHSAGYVQDIINLIELAGCEVDFMTLYDFKGQKENQYNILTRPWKLRLVEMLQKHSWLRLFRCLYHLPYLLIAKLTRRGRSLIHGDYYLVFENEEKPPINPSQIFEKIKKDYDYYVVMIVQDIITSKTIQMLYEKYQKPLIIISPDMYHFTGNCFYPNDCTHYLDECRNCPAFKEIGVEDFAHNNFIFKRKVFETVKCAFICNSHDANFVNQTTIIPKNKVIISTSSFFLDADKFKPYSKELTKKRFSIPEDKSFVVMIRYISPQNHDWKRKGGIYLIETLDKFYNKLTKYEKSKCLLFFVGTKSVDPGLNFKFDTYCAGNLSRMDLILAYNASTVFLCPSINDSGPSMVNQSMACSTPVVAFNQGTAIDMIDNGANGFKVDLYDTDGLSDALVTILHMDEEHYQELSNNARQEAVESCSLTAGARLYQRIFESFENGTL